MTLFIFSICFLLLSGIAAACFRKNAPASNLIGGAGAVFSCILGVVSLIFASSGLNNSVLSLPWQIPLGSFSLVIDPLGTLFLFAIFALSALAALYGIGYMKHYYGKKNIGSTWFFFNTLAASMALVVVSRNAVLFLAAWEAMSVSSFFLVLFEGEKKSSAKAGLIYIIATHVATLFLIAMFILLGGQSGSMDFSQWKIPPAGIMPSVIFILALIGFGTKAGLMPLHIWLPEAHPAAPSHVSAVMSGVMIKTGIYGLIRIMCYLGAPCLSWGYILLVIGIVSGICGVLLAIAQHDLKRLLAYHSIENIGIILIGLGLGVIGVSVNNPALIALGYTGALLHVVNHAFFKGLLFMGSGAVLHGTGTREIDALGGLFKKMPVTGVCFLIGAAAISGLPPLNGFISEFMIYFASFKTILGYSACTLIALTVIGALATIGGLAAACFTKVFGVVFLGEARSEHCRNAHEPGFCMRIAMAVLAAGCVTMGLAGPFILGFFNNVIVNITGMALPEIAAVTGSVSKSLTYIAIISVSLYALIILTAVLRAFLLKGRTVEHDVTWDCGYSRPEPRMQYTGSSFAQPIVDFFKGILRPEKRGMKISKYFPSAASYKTETADMFQGTIFRPAVRAIYFMAQRFTWFQHGRLQLYILYILFTLIALLIWKI